MDNNGQVQPGHPVAPTQPVTSVAPTTPAAPTQPVTGVAAAAPIQPVTGAAQPTTGVAQPTTGVAQPATGVADPTAPAGVIASALQQEAKEVVSGVALALECEKCQAQILVEMSDAAATRCHWCETTLSVNRQIPMGASANGFLPFKITRDQGMEEIKKYLMFRSFFAVKGFSKGLKAETANAVFLPLLLIDASAHVRYTGQGEHLTREVSKQNYNADLYNVEREFDVVLDGMPVELSNAHLFKYSKWVNTMLDKMAPYELDQASGWQMSNLKGYTGENLNVSVDGFSGLVDEEVKKAVQDYFRTSLTLYDRGISWRERSVEMRSKSCRLVYVPVWLYGFQTRIKENNYEGFVGVSSRNRVSVGYVPINYTKLYATCVILGVLGILGLIFAGFLGMIMLILAGLTYVLTRVRYEGWLMPETVGGELKTKYIGERKVDQFIQKEEGLTNARILGNNLGL